MIILCVTWHYIQRITCYHEMYVLNYGLRVNYDATLPRKDYYFFN